MSPPSCSVAEEPDPENPGGYRTVLTPDRSDVEFTTVLLTEGSGAGHYQHTLIWHDLPCHLLCHYSYQVRSYSDTRMSSSSVKAFKIMLCAQQN